MEALINRLIDNELEDFKGLKIIGSIPVSEQIVNELAQHFLKDTLQKDETPTVIASDTKTASADGSVPDMLGLVKKLDIHNFRITFEQGKMVLNLDIRR